MKGKTKTYVLLATVLGIWGTIGYQIVNGLSDKVPEVAQNDFDTAFTPKTRTVIDTFSIQLLDRDPFLGKLANNKISARPKLNRIIKDTAWAPITYHGLVKRGNSRNSVFVIAINGNQHLLKKGQEVNNVTLLKGNDKEILIRYKNTKKTIAKQ